MKNKNVNTNNDHSSTIGLTKCDIKRYSRNLPVIGLEGQEKLKNAKILCIGAGGLGCPALQYLAAAGIGTLGIIDHDQVDLSNLQRQILFTEADIGKYKAEVAAQRLLQLNSNITITPYVTKLQHTNLTITPHKTNNSKQKISPFPITTISSEELENNIIRDGFDHDNHSQALNLYRVDAEKIINQYDVILDATDNYEARYLINAICRKLNKPLVSASIFQFDAQISVFNHQNGPCYQCLFPEPPPADLVPNCAQGGVLGVLPGVAGTIQATEAIKVILDIGDNLSGKLLNLDLLTMNFKTFDITKGDCDNHPNIEFSKNEISAGNMAHEIINIAPDTLHEYLTSNVPIQLIDVREDYERAICQISGTHIPLAELEDKLLAKKNIGIDPDALTIVYCKLGGRSARACEMLRQAGFSQVQNLSGGIIGWIEAVDQSLMAY